MRTNDEVIELIKELLNENKISMSELARRTDMAKSAVSRYLNKTREFPLNRADEFARALNISTEYLLGVSPMTDIAAIYNQLDKQRQEKVYDYAERQLEDQNKIITLHNEVDEKTSVDVQSTLSAGTGIIDLDPEYVDTIEYKGFVPKHDLAFVVDGDSMEPMFEDGEVVFIEKTPDIHNGQIIAVQINEEAYIKKVYKENNHLRLVSLNKEYDDIVANKSDDIRIIGRVIL